VAKAPGISSSGRLRYLSNYDYYEDVAGSQLADEFYVELRLFFQKAAVFS